MTTEMACWLNAPTANNTLVIPGHRAGDLPKSENQKMSGMLRILGTVPEDDECGVVVYAGIAVK